MIIVSIDLAIKPQNVGLCVVEQKNIRFPSLSSEVVDAMRGFHATWQALDGGEPASALAAEALARYILSFSATYVVVDGPQGFARTHRRGRRAEAILRTSGRTGPDYELPIRGYSWPGIARLGIKLFDALSQRGHARLEKPKLQTTPSAIEVFPDSSWHSFGLDAESQDQLQRLGLCRGYEWEQATTEHQLDAAVGALTVLACIEGKGVFVGHPFFLDGNVPREGYIVIPNPSGAWIG